MDVRFEKVDKSLKTATFKTQDLRFGLIIQEK